MGLKPDKRMSPAQSGHEAVFIRYGRGLNRSRLEGEAGRNVPHIKVGR